MLTLMLVPVEQAESEDLPAEHPRVDVSALALALARELCPGGDWQEVTQMQIRLRDVIDQEARRIARKIVACRRRRAAPYTVTRCYRAGVDSLPDDVKGVM